MPDYSANINFTFIAPPKQLAFQEGAAPSFKVDASASSLTMQAFLLRILPLLTISSKQGATNYIFEKEA